MSPRKGFEVLSGVGLLVLCGQTWNAVNGSHKLPAWIATHFDAAGHVNGWSSPASLWIFVVLAVFFYILLTVISHFPESFNYPVEVTEENCARLESLTLQLLAVLKVELIWMIFGLEWGILRVARSQASSFSPFFALLMVGVILATVGWHVWAQFRAARPQAD